MVSIEKISYEIKQLAIEYSLKRVDLFGSLANNKWTEQSDIDLLVEFNKTKVSLLLLSSLKLRLEEIFGKKVDIVRAPLLQDSMIKIERSIRIYG